MSAQPADSASFHQVVVIPKTVRGVRAALPAAAREVFEAELDQTSIPDISAMVERWWRYAVIESSPRAGVGLARARAGQLEPIDVPDVVGAERWERALAEAGR